jgi:GNAT superfamily N-acetyltransferase
MNDLPPIEYVSDDNVTVEDDGRIRELLSSCFKGPHDGVFRHQRYFLEPPQHRWVMRDDDHGIIAHLAVHDKIIGSVKGELHIGGVAEVCTRLDFRRRGYAKALLDNAHAWMRENEFAFAMLFGAVHHYQSSGYRNVSNLIRYWEPKQQEWVITPVEYVMICPLSDRSWPDGTIDLRGPCF